MTLKQKSLPILGHNLPKLILPPKTHPEPVEGRAPGSESAALAGNVARIGPIARLPFCRNS
jgi:hypothetical protein